MGFHVLVLVALLSLALYVYMLARVGMARAKYNVPAPATTGHPDFERVVRVQANTLEGLVVYLPALFIFGLYVHDYIGAALGVVWIIGRYVYMEGYIEAAEKRSTGFMIQVSATFTLLIGSFVGVVWKLVGLNAIL